MALSEVREAAESWRGLGIAVIPIIFRSKVPALPKWKPYQSCLPRQAELDTWFNGRSVNLAVVTGWQGLVVIDFDDLWQYSRWLAGLPTERAVVALSTYQTVTRRGRHFYFFVEEETRSCCAVRPKIDVIAGGNLCTVPPSVHSSGHVYVSVGNPQDIQHIPSLRWLGLEPDRPKIAHAPPEPVDLDDLAMRHDCGTSISDLKARWSSHSLLGLPPGRQCQIRCPLPSHEDIHPSCTLFADGGWYCHVCQKGGDVVDLYAALNGLTLRDAMREMGNADN